MDSGALCVTISLQQRQQGLLAINLDLLLDTTTMKLLVQLTHREYNIATGSATSIRVDKGRQEKWWLDCTSTLLV
jgi:hypothetical protein